MRLKGKTALITGAADGIGRATALAMVREGASVIIADINEEKGRVLQRQIESDGGTALFIPCDIGSGPQVEALVDQAIGRFGKIDILHNNAAIDFQSPFVEMEEESWQRVINVNLTGAFRLCRYVVPHMIRRGGGSIVNTSSVQAFLGFANYTAYAAAKGGIISMTRQLAVELAPFLIRVNSVSPGTIKTPMMQMDLDKSENPEALLRELADLHVLRRNGEPEEVAAAVVFLASHEAGFITGTDLKVDGGMVVKP